MEPYDRLLLPENLYYAWAKAKNLYRMADGYVDNGELAEFELDLERRLDAIHTQFKRCSFRLRRVRPLPRPKSFEGEDPIDRQYFHISVDDQVAWIAVVNAVGPELDKRMPPWSYGNRIYRPAWYEENEDRNSILEIGPYRHASGQLYRKFRNSWPLFRRHIALCARAMARAEPLDHDDLDRSDQLAAAAAEREQLPYLLPEFWNHLGRQSGSDTAELYHASLDLKQFYPRINTTCVLDGLLSAGSSRDGRMESLLSSMLRFRPDMTNCPSEILEKVQPKFLSSRTRGIPTGLFVAGFLANVAMLSVDKVVNERVRARRSVAHFRFVDDHTILAFEFDELCTWITWYRDLLGKCDTGAVLNPEKFDPPELAAWVKYGEPRTNLEGDTSLRTRSRLEKRREAAINGTRFDGKHPTRLLTKTLGQVSEIAATNFDVLDDDELAKQLGLVEWLLLAEISEREIRPDTRAAFAAGRLTLLAPMLVQEREGLVELARSMVGNLSGPNDESTGTVREVSLEDADREANILRLRQLEDEQTVAEEQHLRRCFGWLLQAFQQFPGKARLFQRLHQYCRVTGYHGLSELVAWIGVARSRNVQVWGNYYAGCMLQLLGRGVLHAIRVLSTPESLLSEKDAARAHLEDVSNLRLKDLLVSPKSEAWFHAAARREFGVTLLVAAENVRSLDNLQDIAERFSKAAVQCLHISFQVSSDIWKQNTGKSPGVWAHMTEEFLSDERKPSASWIRFDTLFSTSNRHDVLAARRYPEIFSERRWLNLLQSKARMSESESGWLLEIMDKKEGRISASARSRRGALSRAAKSTRSTAQDVLSLVDWTSFVASSCTPFDPRRSEWTALEIIRQLVSPLVTDFGVEDTRVKNLHPRNVYVPRVWKEGSHFEQGQTVVGWEGWREFARDRENGCVSRAKSDASIIDYRYFAKARVGGSNLNWEATLVAVGRLLLGVLRLDHSVPRLWNLRGNERSLRLPLSNWFRSLAISSRTLLLLEGCLSARSAESRAIISHPDLFGWSDGLQPNDSEFEPPLVRDVNELLDSIKGAQKALENNQLSVLMNRPRQLIPFRLRDFATGEEDGGEGDELVE